MYQLFITEKNKIMNDNFFNAVAGFLNDRTIKVEIDTRSIIMLSAGILLAIVLGILIGNIVTKQTY